MSDPWIGVDLDGTLAYYDHWRGILHIGDPIPAMLHRVRQWVEEGTSVKVFTARVCLDKGDRVREEVVAAIHAWLERHGLPKLEVTNVKDFGLTELWDDRAVRVEPNTGEVSRQTQFT